jgi:hypothetical protein
MRSWPWSAAQQLPNIGHLRPIDMSGRLSYHTVAASQHASSKQRMHNFSHLPRRAWLHSLFDFIHLGRARIQARLIKVCQVVLQTLRRTHVVNISPYFVV